MKSRLIHTNHLGNVCSEHGDVCRKDTTAQTVFDFESVEEARQHARNYVARFPELECSIDSIDDSIHEVVRNGVAQAEYIQMYCTVSARTRFRDAIALVLIVGSLFGNIVMAVLLFRRP